MAKADAEISKGVTSEAWCPACLSAYMLSKDSTDKALTISSEKECAIDMYQLKILVCDLEGTLCNRLLQHLVSRFHFSDYLKDASVLGSSDMQQRQTNHPLFYFVLLCDISRSVSKNYISFSDEVDATAELRYYAVIWRGADQFSITRLCGLP